MSTGARKEGSPIINFLQKRSSRRSAIEAMGFYGGGIISAVAVADGLVSSRMVYEQVSAEAPPLVNPKGEASLNVTINDITAVKEEERTPAQQATLKVAQETLNYQTANEAARFTRATEVQSQSDNTVIAGTITRGSLRSWAFWIGAPVAAASAISWMIKGDEPPPPNPYTTSRR